MMLAVIIAEGHSQMAHPFIATSSEIKQFLMSYKNSNYESVSYFMNGKIHPV
jgi:hypothetical protein